MFSVLPLHYTPAWWAHLDSNQAQLFSRKITCINRLANYLVEGKCVAWNHFPSRLPLPPLSVKRSERQDLNLQDQGQRFP